MQVYAGCAFGGRDAFSDHTWLAVKPATAGRYSRYDQPSGSESGASRNDRKRPHATVDP
ncbi:MAG: hypothetical protein IT521_07245 [Burkholderiales bacterium]|nr:hypothetical protein [Burkholderiales bacterium]